MVRRALPVDIRMYGSEKRARRGSRRVASPLVAVVWPGPFVPRLVFHGRPAVLILECWEPLPSSSRAHPGNDVGLCVVGHTASTRAAVAEVIPGHGSQMEAVCRQVLETAEPVVNVELEGEVPSASGHRLRLASCYPVRIEDQVIGIGIVVGDITEREEADRLRAAVMDTMVSGPLRNRR
jgi:hypothetical protein